MQFSDDLGKLIIRNMEIIETAPGVVNEVEKLLFAAINGRIKRRMPRGWDGVYDLVTDQEDKETTFRPNKWPVDDDGGYEAWYYLYCTEAGSDYWLSNATGVKGAALCFGFGFNYGTFNMNRRQYRAKLAEVYNNNPTLAERGFLLQQGNSDEYISIIRPLHFDAGTLAKEFPDFDEALKPLDEALDDLFEVHPVFNKFVKEIQK